jgi:hypothetical protein
MRATAMDCGMSRAGAASVVREVWFGVDVLSVAPGRRCFGVSVT